MKKVKRRNISGSNKNKYVDHKVGIEDVRDVLGVTLDDDVWLVKDILLISISSLSFKQFKTFILHELSKPLDTSQRYLTKDPLTEKYIFYWWGNYRLISANVIDSLLKKKKLKYFTYKGNKTIVSGNFCGKIIKTMVNGPKTVEEITKIKNKKPTKEKKYDKKKGSWLTNKKKSKKKKPVRKTKKRKI